MSDPPRRRSSSALDSSIARPRDHGPCELHGRQRSGRQGDHRAALEDFGANPAPTAGQLRLLERLGTECGKTYKVPITRAQVSSKVALILDAGAFAPGRENETETAAS